MLAFKQRAFLLLQSSELIKMNKIMNINKILLTKKHKSAIVIMYIWQHIAADVAFWLERKCPRSSTGRSDALQEPQVWFSLKQKNVRRGVPAVSEHPTQNDSGDDYWL